MPKLRNGSGELMQFAQWLGRKCRNHNPLQELESAASERQKLPGRYKTAAAAHNTVQIADIDEDLKVITYTQAGRTFALSVREVTGNDVVEEELRKAKRVAVAS